MTDVIVAVDVGRSKCRLRVTAAHSVTGCTVAGGAVLSDSGGARAMIAWLTTAIDSALQEWTRRSEAEHARPVAIGVSAAGASPDSEASRTLAHDLGRAYGCRVSVFPDAVASHAGALGGRQGAVLAVGTGSVALALDAHGSRHVDGWGQHVGDDGSGWWIGRAGMNAAARIVDGRGPATRLAQDFEARFGHLDFGRLMADPQPFRTIASFSREVIAAAEQGDDVSRGIVADAASHLAHSLVTAAAALRPGTTRLVSATGGLMKSPYVATLVESNVRTLSLERGLGAAWLDAAGDAVDGATRIAAGKSPLHDRLVTTWAQGPAHTAVTPA